MCTESADRQDLLEEQLISLQSAHNEFEFSVKGQLKLVAKLSDVQSRCGAIKKEVHDLNDKATE
jgi:hypothetical protein